MINRRSFLTLAAGAAIPSLLSSASRAAPVAPSASAAPSSGIKITDVKVVVLDVKYPCTLVRVTTDAGISGIGEAYPRIPQADHILSLKRHIIGEDPTQVKVLYAKLMDRTIGHGGWAGAMAGAIAGIESALWDLAGKILKVPVYKLLGGKFRDKVLIYHDTGSPKTHDPRAWVDEAVRSKEYGFQAMKFDLNPTRGERWNKALHPADIREWLKILEAIRSELGPDFPFGIDFHWKYHVGDIMNFIKEADYLNLWFIEDPIPPQDADTLKRVSDATDIPIVTGENLFTRTTWKPFIEKQACDAIQPDPQKCGGLLETQWIAEWAAMYSMPLFVHNLCTPVGTIASAHLCASQQSFVSLESDSVEIPHWQNVVQHDGSFYNEGYLELNEKPGFGFELNEDVCRRHLIEDHGFFDE